MEQTDIVIIGSGIGGLSCAALLARYGLSVLVCESHAILGGAAHGFEYQGFKFDSVPSPYSGLSYSPSPLPNPMRQVMDAIAADVEWRNYDTWGCCLLEGTFDTQVGADQFCEILQRWVMDVCRRWCRWCCVRREARALFYCPSNGW
jgi:phytoene dehydrogenase-like protein